MQKHPLYIFMISVHGLIRGHDPELGRDADTGGQITYVLDLARALGFHPEVRKVDLLTRLIEDPAVGPDYAEPEEVLGPNARILRLPFGPKRYLRKELLWNHLDQLVDRVLHFLREQGQLPDVIHSHYADAGYVGYQLSQLLGVPQIHTGHSLGRCKRQRLLDSGRKATAIDRQFNFARRIAAEEQVLEHAALIITSTTQERDEQYGMYQRFNPKRCLVLPPGIDFTRFSAAGAKTVDPRVKFMIDRFLHEPCKPMILTLSRPAPRKNLLALIEAYGEDEALQELANLVILAGHRGDLRDLEETQAAVVTELLLAIDRYDLYGKVALPKRHAQEDVPQLYRFAARHGGVFVNPALTEPFGLTLLEAAASGLPIVATQDGGPRDILANCGNGLLIDPLDKKAMAATLREALSDSRRWKTWSKAGKRRVVRHYSWPAHVDAYLKNVGRLLHRTRKTRRRSLALASGLERPPLPLAQWALISDIDNTLLGDRQGLSELLEWLTGKPEVGFGIATGRTVDSAAKVLRQWGVRTPDVLITAVGSEIYYGPDLSRDEGWSHYIRHLWRRNDLAGALQNMPGLRLQKRSEQREFKLSYRVDPQRMPALADIENRLRERRLHASLIYSHNQFLDVLPLRASKGHAVRYLAYKFGLPLERFLVAGDSGNDVEMMVGDTLGVIVSNYSGELEHLREQHRVYFAPFPYALGILAGIHHYRFADAAATMIEGNNA
ncbi:HAD-IIB family hydrolase [Methylococcus sp. EFPC2]|uniref:HAD-IIB family hydrolase n=1 Tax=Methylococcus sp. EFPC2 TaxID=2812648 RepID=UPI001967E26E|nr:HAD-IIB family hydrolase [Methylococcus sp. EFPC2]QSA97481.1 HAD-IIB family hydrolase [Methylococcus sp. EFPC2]